MTEAEHECPKEGCGYTSETERGISLHHMKAHGESIAGVEVECAWCGKILQRKQYMVEQAENNFCSDDCHGKWKSENLSGENAHAWEGGLVTVECDYCGEETEKTKCRVRKYDHAFCDTECRSGWLSENHSGEGNPSWKGGGVSYRGSNWTRQRRRALNRDGYKCQACGTSEEELDRALDVHHITPLREYESENGEIDFEAAHDLENLVTLCRPCHQKYEGLPVVPRAK